MAYYKFEVVATNGDSTYIVLKQGDNVIYMCEYRRDNDALYRDLGRIIVEGDEAGFEDWGTGHMEQDMYDYADFNAYYADLMADYGKDVNAPQIISSGDFNA